MDQAEQYYQLVMQGRDAFLRQTAPAALVRRRTGETDDHDLPDSEEGDTLVAATTGTIPGMAPGGTLRVYPLLKKQGAPFADMITVGRTKNNDVVIDDVTVSRFHAFFRQKNGHWIVCDSGSKNGTRLDGGKLEARKERAIESGQRVVLGDVETVFYRAEDLFDILTGSVR